MSGKNADSLDILVSENNENHENDEGAIELEKYQEARREFFGSGTYCSWISISVFLVSFGVIINNTNRTGGEPKIGTAMASLGLLFTIWASFVYFRSNWPVQPRPALIMLLFLILLLIAVAIWIIARIWI